MNLGRSSAVVLPQRVGNGLNELHDPRSPTRSNVRVEFDNVSLPHGRESVPTWSLSHRLRALAIEGVGQENDVRVGRDDEFTR